MRCAVQNTYGSDRQKWNLAHASTRWPGATGLLPPQQTAPKMDGLPIGQCSWIHWHAAVIAAARALTLLLKVASIVP